MAWASGDSIEIRFKLWGVRATLAIILLLYVVYGFQLAMAGSIERTAAYTVIDDHLQHNPLIFVVLAPFLHSYHGHIFWNSMAILVAGTYVERHVGRLQFIMFFYIGGIWINITSALLGFGLGAGASGVAFGLLAFMGLSLIRELMIQTPRSKWAYVYAGLGALLLSRALIPFLRITGTAPITEGTGGHLIGSIFGICLFGVRTLGSRNY